MNIWYILEVASERDEQLIHLRRASVTKSVPIILS